MEITVVILSKLNASLSLNLLLTSPGLPTSLLGTIHRPAWHPTVMLGTHCPSLPRLLLHPHLVPGLMP